MFGKPGLPKRKGRLHQERRPFRFGQIALTALYFYIPISLKAHSYIILPTFLYRLDIGML